MVDGRGKKKTGIMSLNHKLNFNKTCSRLLECVGRRPGRVVGYLESPMYKFTKLRFIFIRLAAVVPRKTPRTGTERRQVNGQRITQLL